ncbi:MAG: class I SAM-dependent methyltransferase [Desulfobacterales bacterium]
MSKLDSFIRRMTAQRDCLNHAANLITHVPGPVFELGLGNGRTYDHLRQLFPDRDVYVFDRMIGDFTSCIPPENRLFLGEISDTLLCAEKNFLKTIAMVHYDLGLYRDKAITNRAATVARLLIPLVTAGGVIVSNHKMSVENWVQLPEPPGVKQGRYFLYRNVCPCIS